LFTGKLLDRLTTKQIYQSSMLKNSFSKLVLFKNKIFGKSDHVTENGPVGEVNFG